MPLSRTPGRFSNSVSSADNALLSGDTETGGDWALRLLGNSKPNALFFSTNAHLHKEVGSDHDSTARGEQEGCQVLFNLLQRFRWQLVNPRFERAGNRDNVIPIL